MEQLRPVNPTQRWQSVPAHGATDGNQLRSLGMTQEGPTGVVRVDYACDIHVGIETHPRGQPVREVLPFIIFDYIPIDHERQSDISCRSPG